MTTHNRRVMRGKPRQRMRMLLKELLRATSVNHRPALKLAVRGAGQEAKLRDYRRM